MDFQDTDQGGDIELILIVVNKKARPQGVNGAESLVIRHYTLYWGGLE